MGQACCQEEKEHENDREDPTGVQRRGSPAALAEVVETLRKHAEEPVFPTVGVFQEKFSRVPPGLEDVSEVSPLPSGLATGAIASTDEPESSDPSETSGPSTSSSQTVPSSAHHPVVSLELELSEGTLDAGTSGFQAVPPPRTP